MTNLRLLIAVILFTLTTAAQEKPSVTFDPQTGNYIIDYEGHEGEDQTPAHVRLIFEPSTKIKPYVESRTVKIDGSIGFRYVFKLRNGATSQQRLNSFEIDLNSKTWDAKSPAESWWQHSYSYVPVFGWLDSKGEHGLASPLDGIAPDSSEAGFSFNSTGVPAIVNAYLRGAPTTVLAFPDEPPGEIETLLEPLRRFPNNSVIRKTVGPKDPPHPFIAAEFLDTLLSYIHQSHELGWINNTRDDDAEADERAEDGIVKNLDKRLMQTRDLIVKDKIGAAKGRLTIFLNKVERLWDRQQKEDKRNRKNPKIIFTSEAYALLKYNGEYLLDHLTEPKEGKDGKDKGKEEKKGREK
jgi:hypothetical protein